MRNPARSDDVLVVRGGASLHGRLRVHGAKNSALKLMAASLLAAPGETVLHNVPQIADVPAMGEILRGLGADVTIDGETVRITFADDPHDQPPREHMVKLRASITVLGPLVGRLGHATVARPGGDRIGQRSIDFHLRGLEAIGATVIDHGDAVEVVADELHGGQITLDFPSVTATENLVMAAVLAAGPTTIDGAAREPEVVDLCRMLVEMGAHIEGIGSPTIEVDGVDELRPVTHTTVPDRIEAATFAAMAAVTGGDVELTNVRPPDLNLPLMKLRDIGAVVEEGGDTLRVKAGDLRAVNFVTLPYPGFPTDLQPQYMVLLSQAVGTSMCTENVFESRFSFVDELHKMGADIQIEGHHAIIRGRSRLRGAVLDGLDVRAGAAGVMAGMVADGQTVVTGVHHIDRGYAGFVERLRSLGADIEQVPRSELDLPDLPDPDLPDLDLPGHDA
ncbi:MAG TPA: UDP-N-acetylglucosamine 1-carboxyvinyltransferase [Nitriliruptorales bacterium]